MARHSHVRVLACAWKGVAVICLPAEMLKTNRRGGPPCFAVLRAPIASGGFQPVLLRVTATLTDVVNYDGQVDGGLHAIFELQDCLVRELAGTLRRRVSTPETGAVTWWTCTEAFSRGLPTETFETPHGAVWLFERAVRLDPSYARAHVELGAAYGTKAALLSALGRAELDVSARIRRIRRTARSNNHTDRSSVSNVRRAG